MGMIRFMNILDSIEKKLLRKFKSILARRDKIYMLKLKRRTSTNPKHIHPLLDWRQLLSLPVLAKIKSRTLGITLKKMRKIKVLSMIWFLEISIGTLERRDSSNITF